jgi:phosphopantetheine adenylyltransferase
METVDRLIVLVNQRKPLDDLAEVAERLDLQCEVTEGLRSLWVTAMTSVLKHSAVRSGTGPNARLWTAIELFDQHLSW